MRCGGRSVRVRRHGDGCRNPGSVAKVSDITWFTGATSAVGFECESSVSDPETLIIGLMYPRSSVKALR
jgi:hypothetical protein